MDKRVFLLYCRRCFKQEIEGIYREIRLSNSYHTINGCDVSCLLYSKNTVIV
nr:MAG TPA: hypothetical protein [Caudoviricetes sp.]